jgi:hypothetical protein
VSCYQRRKLAALKNPSENALVHHRTRPARIRVHQSPASRRLEFAPRTNRPLRTYQITRFRWRGDPGGVLPFGYDANSIAAEAILELLSTDPASAPSPPFANGSPTTPPPAFRAGEGVGEGLRGNRKSKIKNRKFSLPFRSEEIPPNNSPFEPTNRRRKSSADFQSAVSPISNRQAVESSRELEVSQVPQAGSPAIQQIGNLRYELREKTRVRFSLSPSEGERAGVRILRSIRTLNPRTGKVPRVRARPMSPPSPPPMGRGPGRGASLSALVSMSPPAAPAISAPFTSTKPKATNSGSAHSSPAAPPTGTFSKPFSSTSFAP